MIEENSKDKGLRTDEPAKSKIGRIEWVDLTVGDAARSKSFYCKVIHHKSTDVEI